VDEEIGMGAAKAVELETHDAREEQAGRPGDAEIRDAVGRGDHRAAIELCVTHHGGVVGRLCMSLLGSQADAEDVAQETLVDAYKGLGGWRGEGSIRGWLMTIARRKCARQLERRGRKAAKLRLIEGEPSGVHAEQQVLLRQRADQARAALGHIRPSEREALVLRYGAGLSFAEVGQAFEIDEAAARKRVSRGVAALRQRLQKEG